MDWIRVVWKADRKAGRYYDVFLYNECPVCKEKTIEHYPTYCPHCGTKIKTEVK